MPNRAVADSHKREIGDDDEEEEEQVERRAGELKDGEREDSDKEDRQLDEQTSHVFQEEEWVVEESQGVGNPMRRGGRSHHLLQHWEAL